MSLHLSYRADPGNPWFSWQYVRDNSDTILAALREHTWLTARAVVIAALVGSDGLGKPVVRALNTVNVAMGFEAGMAIVILAIVLDRVCKRPDRAGRRSRRA